MNTPKWEDVSTWTPCGFCKEENDGKADGDCIECQGFNEHLS